MKLDASNGENGEWSTSDIRGYVMAMIEFLKFSPSYELARLINTEQLSEVEWHEKLFALYDHGSKNELTTTIKDELIEDFQLVLKTYQEYGDVSNITSYNWWMQRGVHIYAAEHEAPCVRKISLLKKGSTLEDDFPSLLKNYAEVTRIQEGQPNAMIVSIPLGVIDKKTLFTQLSSLIDLTCVQVSPKSEKAKKSLTAKRLRLAPLFMYMTVLMSKSKFPSIELWKLGVISDVSPKNAVGLDIDIPLTIKTNVQASKMAILTSRALRKAKLISEHAARGKFPNSEIRLLPYFDFEDIYQVAVLQRKKTIGMRVINTMIAIKNVIKFGEVDQIGQKFKRILAKRNIMA